jgi:hypothetical protein
MNPEAPELDLRLPAPDVSVAEVDALCEHIRGRGWTKAGTLTRELGLDDRKLRAIANASDGRILSGPGCPGYKLFDGDTCVDDAIRAATALQSQGQRMQLRAAAIWRRYHRYARG